MVKVYVPGGVEGDVETVNVEDALPDNEDELNEPVVYAGRFETLRDTFWLKP